MEDPSLNTLIAVEDSTNPGQVEHTMGNDKDVERLLEILFAGDRAAARAFVDDRLEAGNQEVRLITDVVTQAIRIIGKLEREDRISSIAVNTPGSTILHKHIHNTAHTCSHTHQTQSYTSRGSTST